MDFAYLEISHIVCISMVRILDGFSEIDARKEQSMFYDLFTAFDLIESSPSCVRNMFLV